MCGLQELICTHTIVCELFRHKTAKTYETKHPLVRD